MGYAIVGMTKDEEYIIAVDIICRHKEINPHDFIRGVDNVFDDMSQAQQVLDELTSTSQLQSCPFAIYKK